MHPAIKKIGRAPFERGYSIVDPDIVEKVAKDAASRQGRGLVEVCTTVDAWAPEAQKLDLGRRCLKALLAEPDWNIRILTKNAAVTKDFDLIKKYRDRVTVGLSLTGTVDKQDILSVIEPYASPIADRMAAMQKAHKMGLRTFGMLCPLLPGIGDSPEQIDQLVRFVAKCGAEEVFCEAVNQRGNNLTMTESVLRENGFLAEAEAVGKIRKRVNRSAYTVELSRNVQAAMRKHMSVKQLRFLLYTSALTPDDEARIRKAPAGVVWLTKEKKQ